MTTDISLGRLTLDPAPAERALARIGDGVRRAATADLGTFAQNAQRAFNVNQVVAFAQGVVGVGTSIARSVAAAEAHERAVRTLGRSYQDVARETAGVVTAEQALRVQQTLVQSGLRVSAAELGTITRAAREYATANGTELQPALDQLTDALRNGEAGGLRRYGVALGQNTTRAQAFDATIHTLTTRQRGHAVQTQTLSERMTTLGTTFATAGGQIVRFLTETSGLGAWLSGAISQVSELVRSMGELAARATENARPNSDVNQQRDIVRNAAALERDREGLSDQLTRLRGAGLQVADLDRDAFRQERLGVAGTAAMAGRLRTLVRAMRFADTNEERLRLYNEFRGGAFGETVSAANASRAAEAQALAPPPATADGGSRTLLPEPRGGGGGRGEDPLAQLMEQSERVKSRLNQFGARTYELPRAPGESLAAYVRRLLAENERYADVLEAERAGRGRAQQAAEQAAATEREGVDRRATELASAERDAANERKANIRRITAEDETRRRRESFGQQMGQAFGVLDDNGVERQVSAAQRLSEGVRGAFDAMTSSVQAHYAAVVEGRESAGEAMRGILHDTLLSIGQRAVVESLANTAAALAAAAVGNYPGAASHAAAAGVWAGVAVLAGVGAAATTAPAAARAPAAAPDPGGFGGGVRHANGGSEPRSVTYTINVNGALSTREDIQDAVVQAQDRAGLRGVRPRSEIMAARRRAT